MERKDDKLRQRISKYSSITKFHNNLYYKIRPFHVNITYNVVSTWESERHIRCAFRIQPPTRKIGKIAGSIARFEVLDKFSKTPRFRELIRITSAELDSFACVSRNPSVIRNRSFGNRRNVTAEIEPPLIARERASAHIPTAVRESLPLIDNVDCAASG